MCSPQHGKLWDAAFDLTDHMLVMVDDVIPLGLMNISDRGVGRMSAIKTMVLPASVAAGLVGVAWVGLGQAAQEKGVSVDPRAVIVLDEQARAAILEEMRHHLSGIQAMTEALAKGDMRTVAKTARASGMTAAREADPRMQEQLPQEFKNLGFSMHKDFDAMAADAEKYRDPKRTLRRLSATLRKCNACHASYQIQTKAGSLRTKHEHAEDEHGLAGEIKLEAKPTASAFLQGWCFRLGSRRPGVGRTDLQNSFCSDGS
jgi:hypothetical protein